MIARGTAFVASHDVEHLQSCADTLSWLRCCASTFYSDRTTFDDVLCIIRCEAAEQVWRLKIPLIENGRNSP